MGPDHWALLGSVIFIAAIATAVAALVYEFRR